MDGGAWWAAVHGVTKSRTRLSDFTFIFHFHALEKEMTTHSIVLAWRIPGTGKPGGLLSMGLHRVGQRLKRLSSSRRDASSFAVPLMLLWILWRVNLCIELKDTISELKLWILILAFFSLTVPNALQKIILIYNHTSILSGEGSGTPLQYFCLENPMDRGAWWAAVPGVARVGYD